MIKEMKLIDNLKNNKLEYLFYLFVFLLPWQTRWIIKDSYFEYGRISLYGFDIILIILLVFLLFKTGKINNKLFFYGSLALVFFSFLSVFWAANKLVSVYWGVRMLLGFGLFWRSEEHTSELQSH